MRAAAFLVCLVGCAGAGDPRPLVTISSSEVGAEGEALRQALGRFARARPDLRVAELGAPDAADSRHQLYAEWLNAHAGEPDVLQLDVIWTAELAAAGWILPLDRFAPDRDAFVPAALEAARWQGQLFALPWFVDAGVLYYRSDLIARPPATFEELAQMAEEARARAGVRYGFVLPCARYEGLSAIFLELAGGFGGHIIDDGRVGVDSPAAVRALGFLDGAIRRGVVPRAALTWQEEQVRFAFQGGDAVFMRNWPYAVPLLERSAVAGKFAVAPLPAERGGASTSALGGAQLAINAYSRHPDAAYALVAFLTSPSEMVARARAVGEYPARAALYHDGSLIDALPIAPERAAAILARAVPRPVTPVYAQLSESLQVRLHRALTGQQAPAPALAAAAREMSATLAEIELPAAIPVGESPERSWPIPLALGAALIAAGLAAAAWLRRSAREERLAWLLVAPAVGAIALIALAPLGWTFWESLHHHDLRMPWRGHPFAGAANYVEALRAPRFWAALGHTAFFTVASVTLELGLGLVFALALHRVTRARGLLRAAVLVPWAIPTVAVALAWRFLFESRATWFVDAHQAWVPLIAADVWKTTPFVALLLLAGLQNIDETLYEAARIDGARAWQQLVRITLPLLRPAILVALIFRTLDAVRLFDLVYVLTGGGPGTATEPIALYTFSAMLQNLRFGYGSALALLVFAITFALALVYVRLLGADLTR